MNEPLITTEAEVTTEAQVTTQAEITSVEPIITECRVAHIDYLPPVLHLTTLGHPTAEVLENLNFTHSQPNQMRPPHEQSPISLADTPCSHSPTQGNRDLVLQSNTSSAPQARRSLLPALSNLRPQAISGIQRMAKPLREFKSLVEYTKQWLGHDWIPTETTSYRVRRNLPRTVKRVLCYYSHRLIKPC